MVLVRVSLSMFIPNRNTCEENAFEQTEANKAFLQSHKIAQWLVIGITCLKSTCILSINNSMNTTSKNNFREQIRLSHFHFLRVPINMRNKYEEIAQAPIYTFALSSVSSLTFIHSFVYFI